MARSRTTAGTRCAPRVPVSGAAGLPPCTAAAARACTASARCAAAAPWRRWTATSPSRPASDGVPPRLSLPSGSSWSSWPRRPSWPGVAAVPPRGRRGRTRARRK